MDDDKVVQRLRAIRDRKDLTLPPNQYLKPTFTDFDGKEKPINLRYYQIQGILHLVGMKRFLLGDGTGLGKCVTLDSLVQTDRGLVQLGELGPEGPWQEDTFYEPRSALKVWTGWEWAPLKKFYYNGVKPALTFVTRRGYEITGSLAHPLWARTNGTESFIPARSLTKGMHLALSRQCPSFPETEPALPVPKAESFDENTRLYSVPDRLTPPLASLLGYLVSEGWSNSRFGFDIAQDLEINPEIHAHIQELCAELLDRKEGTPQKGLAISVSSVFLREYFLGLGVGMGVSCDKQVPWPIFQGTRDSIVAFLRAFFDGEAHVSDGSIEVASASERMLREIQVLLLQLGILCTRSKKRVKGRKHIYWRLVLCGQDAVDFQETIGFLTPRKKAALAELSSKKRNANLDVIPCAKALVENLRLAIFEAVSKTGANENRVGSGLKQFGGSFQKTLANIRHRGRNPTFPFLEMMLGIAEKVGATDNKAYQAMKALVQNAFFYDPIVSIGKSTQEFADLEIDSERHSFVANGFVNHNTLQGIAALCYLWIRHPETKALILTTKSATSQWAKEFLKFTTGIQVFTCMGTKAARTQVREEWLAAEGPAVMVMGYATARGDFSELQGLSGCFVIFDEATAFKNPKAQIHQVCSHLSNQAERSWGLTATLIKNNLMEGHGIYSILVPGLFGSANSFMYYYGIVEMVHVGRGRKVPRLVGYHPEKVAEFRSKIDPYFIGRPKYLVASELPPLIRQVVEVRMNQYQEDKYQEALSGLLLYSEGKEAEEERETTKLTAIIYCQQIVDHPGLIDCEGESEKLETLIDLLTEGDLAGEKVIVFSRFRKMIDLLMPALKAAKVEAVRITGSEAGTERQESAEKFQNPNNPTSVVCITMAGSDAINLQAAKAIIFYDSPWSAGDYIQIIGRMIRLGSIHDKVHAIHLVSRSRKGPTIDHRVMSVLASKMELVEAVLGEQIRGMASSSGHLEVHSEINEIYEALQQDARNGNKA